MIDMAAVDRARATVAAREQERIGALVNEEAARQEHNRLMVATSQAMVASVEHNRQRRIALHEAARSTARAARDHRDELRGIRQRDQNRIGFSRADLVEAQKELGKCLPPDPDTFPTADELDAHRQRFGMLDEACRRLTARIAVEAAELSRAQVDEDSAQATLERAAGEEMSLRP
jgi:hypothetical protein